jgi:hypothetical protein
MTNEEWLDKATEFYIGICPFQSRPLYVSSRKDIMGNLKWVVQLEHSMCWVLGKDNEWHWEPQPSSRTKPFMVNTRFDSPGEAWAFYCKNVTERKELYVS